MATWTRQPQEHDGNFMFDGNLLCSDSVKKKLTESEIGIICKETRDIAKKYNGLDWLQVFANEKGEKIYFIASLNQKIIEICGFNLVGQELNNSVLLFDFEF